MSGARPGMRQRTSRPSDRVSLSRTCLARSHNASDVLSAELRWTVRTAGDPNQASSRSEGMAPDATPPGRAGIVGWRMGGLIQHKREAYWFYRFLSLGYDRWVNPLFWTPAMRADALAEARLEAGLSVLDAGAGTGFTTEGIVATVPAQRVTMLDQ